ncbi:hypothetical protein [Parapedobacter sp. 10938]|uniref:hypothetical protein n=1 Tax=Parapedobacter flavus TaxID=3110225 RepID=UPI002DB8E9C7|nr:hypothetical protein [Parapedobacter sp. 10938]MEC3878777.1 hypothetical protein [Parapedobacter sp. 10938]
MYNTLLIRLLLLFTIITACDNPSQKSVEANQYKLTTADTVNILQAALGSKSTFLHAGRTHTVGLGQLIDTYPLDTVLFIQNDYIPHELPITIPGKIIRFVDEPKGYPKSGYIPIDIDIHVYALSITKDSAHCAIYSAVFGTILDCEMEKNKSVWVITKVEQMQE